MSSNSSDAALNFLPTSEIFPEDDKQFLTKLNVVYTDIAKNLNAREIASYEKVEQLTGQRFFDEIDPQKTRSTYRMVYSFGAVASGATLNIAHGLTNVTMYTRIYGTSKDASGIFKPLPSAEYSVATVGYGIHLEVNGPNIVLVNGTVGTAAALTEGIIVLEYLKT